MIRTLIAILLALPLLSSFALAPAALPNAQIARPVVQTIVVPRAATVYRAQLAIHTSAPPTQDCSYELTETRLRQPIFDPVGYPFGVVSAWSCTGDALAVARELAERADAMQAEAAAYREAHPIGGVR